MTFDALAFSEEEIYLLMNNRCVKEREKSSTYLSLKKKVASPRVDTASKVRSEAHLFCMR